ncbi:MAG: hypothetical protein KUG81_09425 [Gammaproteobacteria bacterium]|nr:hypothetical protein [Gammaproteobacteria bacterium]
MNWLTDNAIETFALAVSIFTLIFTIFVDIRGRRWRKEDIKREQEKTESELIPDVIVKPRFELSPESNRLIIEVINLHSTTAIREFKARCASEVKFDSKKENNNSSLQITAILPGVIKEGEFGCFFCDFDSFVANIGLEGFERSLADVNQVREIKKIREMGFLINGQSSLGTLKISWEYVPALKNTEVIQGEAEYPLSIFEYEHGVFLQLHREA